MRHFGWFSSTVGTWAASAVLEDLRGQVLELLTYFYRWRRMCLAPRFSLQSPQKGWGLCPLQDWRRVSHPSSIGSSTSLWCSPATWTHYYASNKDPTFFTLESSKVGTEGTFFCFFFPFERWIDPVEWTHKSIKKARKIENYVSSIYCMYLYVCVSMCIM